MSKWIWTMLIAALLAVRLPALARPSGGDQGLYSYVAQRVTQGDVPYRDAFEQKPPGIFVVYAAIGLAAPAPAIPGIADLLAAALVAWLLVRLGRQTFGGRAGEGAAILFLLLGDPGIQRLGGMNIRGQCETFIALAVTAAFVHSWRPVRTRANVIIAGACLGAAFWLKYNAIVYAVPIVLLLVASGSGERVGGRRAVGWLAAGIAGPIGLGLLYFTVTGALTDLWLATIRYNVTYSSETYHGLWDAVRYIATLPGDRARVDGLWYLGAVGTVGLLVLGGRRPAVFVALGWIAAAVASIAINGARSLPQYFIQAAPALALTASVGLALAWRARARPRGIVAVAAMGLALLAGAWRVGIELVSPFQPRLFGIPQAVQNLRDDVSYLTGRIDRTTYLTRFDRGDDGKYSPLSVDRLAARVAETTPTDGHAYVFGFASGAALARAHRTSSSRFFWSRAVVLEFARDQPGYGSAGLLADLNAHPPSLIALQKHDWGLAEPTTPDSIVFFLGNPGLRTWLEAGYVPDYEDAAFAVWRRKS